jgi:hypothetical protein
MRAVSVPTLNDKGWHFDQLFGLWRDLAQDRVAVRFDFSDCRFLRQNAVAFLGGLVRLIEYRGGCVDFAWDTLQPDVRANLAQNGFMEAFGGPGRSWSGNSIPFREDPCQNPAPAQRCRLVQRFLSDQWLGRGWVSVSPGLSNAIVGQMAEVYMNAFEHSGSRIGVFSCGQHLPRNRELNLTVVDFGVGIPGNVRLFKADDFGPERLSAAKCMEWAFQRGTTTKPGKPGPGPRGIGLDLLREFVQQNGGRMEMFSHEGYVCVAGGRVSFAERLVFFEGTLVNISLRCDESYYCLASELPNERPF